MFLAYFWDNNQNIITARMSASDDLTMSWLCTLGALLMRTCLAHKSHLARGQECRLVGMEAHAASAAA